MAKIDEYKKKIEKLAEFEMEGWSDIRRAFWLMIEDMRWSFSRVNGWHGCRACWYQTYIIGDRGDTNAFADYGTISHELLESYLKDEISELDLAYEFEKRFIEAELDFPPNQYVNLRDTYYKQGMAYFNTIDLLDMYEVLDVELPIDVNIHGYQVIGFIDAVLRHRKSGKIIVLDHKSKAKFEDANEQKEYARQLYIYSKGVYEKYKEYPSQLVFNRFRKKEYTRIPFKQEDYMEACDWLRDTIEDIKMAFKFPVMHEDDPFFTLYICNHRNKEWHKQGAVIQLE